MSCAARAAAIVAFFLCGCTLAQAQVFVGGATPRAGTGELSGGGFWTGGHSVSGPATLTSNPSSGSSSFDLFNSEATRDQAFGVHGTLGVYLTPTLAIEGGVQYSRPKLEVNLTDDAEDAPDVTATGTLNSYLFTGSLVYYFNNRSRTVPFISGGVGHIRDVDEGNDVVETGIEYHATVGFRSWFGRVRKFGFRAEGGVSIRDGGISFEDGTRVVPLAAASLLYLF